MEIFVQSITKHKTKKEDKFLPQEVNSCDKKKINIERKLLAYIEENKKHAHPNNSGDEKT